jgi:hypothetical protein
MTAVHLTGAHLTAGGITTMPVSPFVAVTAGALAAVLVVRNIVKELRRAKSDAINAKNMRAKSTDVDEPTTAATLTLRRDPETNVYRL